MDVKKVEESIWDILKYKSKVLRLLDKLKISFAIEVNVQYFNDSKIIGILAPNTESFEVIQFFNGLDNTLENVYKDISSFLENSNEVILPDPNNVSEEFITNIFNPYKKDLRNYFFENTIIRVGSLWDQLAHICNIHYNFKIPKNKISENIFLKKNFI